MDFNKMMELREWQRQFDNFKLDEEVKQPIGKYMSHGKDNAPHNEEVWYGYDFNGHWQGDHALFISAINSIYETVHTEEEKEIFAAHTEEEKEEKSRKKDDPLFSHGKSASDIVIMDERAHISPARIVHVVNQIEKEEETMEVLNTLLHEACRKNNHFEVQKLYKRGADLGFVCEEGNTALHHAVLGDYNNDTCRVPLVSFILSMEDGLKGIDAADTNGATPLLKVIEKGSTDIMFLLLSRGANPTGRRLQDAVENPTTDIEKHKAQMLKDAALVHCYGGSSFQATLMLT